MHRPGCARRLLDVSAGGYHTCARRPDREIVCWGDLDPPPAGPFASLYAGPGWHCALDDDGEPRCWGDGPEAQFAVPPGPFVELALGTTHGCALTADGTPRCWGVDQSGETLPPPGRFTALAASPALTCGITAARTLACWGANDNQRAEPPAGEFVALSLGSTLGLVDFLVVWLMPAYGLSLRQSAVVGLTVMLIVLLGTTAGTMLPVLLRRSGMDPAIMSSPLIAAIVDVLGVVIFYEMAMFLL